ncbi:NAD(P)-dependent oxidoreductase [Pseudomonas sp. NPDC007930]|uniref:NAD(P)-dependent oxidoreductase n=1 Tax=Pseudomonas sp. NPDC007930 TaxID=3364417 RepID=UPI0036DFABF5
MQALQIASQLESDFNDALERRVGVPVLRLLPGALEIPDSVRILIAAPLAPEREHALRTPAPAHWPLGLKWVQLVSSGIDIFPDWFFQGVRVSTARGVAAQSISEYALAAILRQTFQLDSLWVNAPEQWRTRRHTLVHGSTVGLVGFGAINQLLAGKLLALGARVVTVRGSQTAPAVEGVERLQAIEQLMAVSDHVVLAAPSTQSTKGIIGAQAWAAAKPGLHLVNVGRGDLIDEAALLAALDSGKASYATLDTTTVEPPPPGHPFYQHPRVALSPHTSAICWESRAALLEKFVDNLGRFTAGLPLLDEVQRGSSCA